MKVILQIQKGTDAGKEILVVPGGSRTVGRQPPSDIICADSDMSVVHFVIECFAQECRVRDLNSRNGTLVNDVRVRAKILSEGDRIRAGKTEFQVRVDGGASAGQKTDKGGIAKSELGNASGLASLLDDANGLTQEQQSLLKILREQAEPLFAILDAARDGRVLDLLRNSKEHYESLYEGRQGEDLANFAPYLVELPKDSPLLIALVKEGWGKSWGIYLTCKEPFKEVRKHFRHFLLVETEDGRQLYFRFYDPRVLRSFLPSSTPREAVELFGPVSSFLAEEADSASKCFLRPQV